MYLPPSRSPWTLVYLDVPATWPGGARRLRARANWGMLRTNGGKLYVWLEITSKHDPHLSPRRGRFYPESLVSPR